MRNLRIRVVAVDIAAALKQVQDRLMSTAVAAKAKANAIAMIILMSITIMTNISLKLIA